MFGRIRLNRDCRRTVRAIALACAAAVVAVSITSVSAQSGPPKRQQKAQPKPAAASKSGIYGKDERRGLPPQYEGLRKSIAQLETRAGQRTFLCTGFCVAESVIATASHCLTEPEVRNHIARTTVLLGQGAERRTSVIRGKSLDEVQWNVVAGTSAVKSEASRSNFAQDWALLRTEQPICKGRVLPVLARRDTPDSWREVLEHKVFLIAFHHDTGARTLRFGDACHGSGTPFEIDIARWVDVAIESDFDDLLPHRCDATQGASGGPIFINEPGGPKVAGIMVGTNRAMRGSSTSREIIDGGSANRGVLSRAFVEQIALANELPPALSRDQVIAIQAALQAKGYLMGPTSGVYDLALRQAILDLERASKRPVTGRPAPWLVALAANPVQIRPNPGPPGRGFAAGPRALERIVAGASRAVEIAPKSAASYIDRGVANVSLGRRSRALADFDAAIGLDANSAAAFAGRGSVLAETGELERALADFTTALGLNPKLAWVANDRGVVLRRLGRLDEAIAEFGRALEIEPRYAVAFGNRANAHRLQRRYDLAIVDYTKVIEINPTSASAFSGRAAASSELGNTDRALVDFDEAIRIDPNVAWVRNDRGLLLRRKGQLDRAIADFSKAIEIEPKLVIAYSNRALTHSDKKDFDAALADYAKAIELEPKRAAHYRSRSGVWESKNNIDRATADLDEAIRLEPGHALAYGLRGHLLRRVKAFDRAIADFDKAIEIDPKSINSLRGRAGVWYDKGNFDRSLVDLDEAIRHGANSASIYNSRGWVNLKLGRLAAARSDADAALRIDPKYSHAADTRAYVLLAAGDHDGALEEFDRAIALGLTGPVPFAGRGQAHERRGDPVRALADYRRSVEAESRADRDSVAAVQLARERIGALEAVRPKE